MTKSENFYRIFVFLWTQYRRKMAKITLFCDNFGSLFLQGTGHSHILRTTNNERSAVDEGNAVHHPGMGWIWLGGGVPPLPDLSNLGEAGPERHFGPRHDGALHPGRDQSVGLLPPSQRIPASGRCLPSWTTFAQNMDGCSSRRGRAVVAGSSTRRPPRHWTARWPNWRGRSGRSAPPLITGMQEKMH